MILKHGYLGVLKDNDLNDLRGNQNNGIYEVNDPSVVSSYYHYPDDYETLSKYFLRSRNGKSVSQDTIDNKDNDPDMYNMYLTYKHNMNPICTGILEVSSYEGLTTQTFTRFPDNTVFTRGYEDGVWSPWDVQLTPLYNRILREPDGKNMWTYNELLQMCYDIIPIFNDRYLWDRLGTKMLRSSYDRLVWWDRPDVMNATCTLSNLVTSNINFQTHGRVADYGILYEKAWDGRNEGLHWIFRWNWNGNDTNIGNDSDTSNLLRIMLHSYKNIFVQNPDGSFPKGRLITRNEWNFQQTAGAGHVVLPSRPQFDLHVYVMEAVIHFIPGLAKHVSMFETSNDSEGIWVRYDGDRTITCDRGQWLHVNWR